MEFRQTSRDNPPIKKNYRVTFLTGPAQKSSKYGTGPTQQQKMSKYTGPTQDTEDDWVFNKQFLSLKKYRFLLQEVTVLDVVDELNNHKQDMVVRSVLKMKERARSCVAVGGGVFEGRKVWAV